VAALAAAIRRVRPHVVHAHNVKAAAEAGIAARLARGPRRPAVLATFHGVLPAEYRSAARLLRAADAVACVSPDLAAGLRAAGLPGAAVVRNGVPPPGAPAPLPAGVAPPVVVAAGRLVAQKNHERLLLAARHVRELGVPATFLVAGDGPLRSALAARARELGLADAVRFLGARDDAPGLMAAADLVAFSSDWEGLSVAALEALAAGTPVVSTPVEGMRELLGDGALATSFAPEELGDLIAGLLRDAPRRAALAAAGRARVEERYSAAAMVGGYERLYRELSARRARAASRRRPAPGGRGRSPAP
jgi:glycosyltransferase involved in cell wall biosynthesis